MTEKNVLESCDGGSEVYHILACKDGGYDLFHSWQSYGTTEFEYIDNFSTDDDLIKYPRLPHHWKEVKFKDSLCYKLMKEV